MGRRIDYAAINRQEGSWWLDMSHCTTAVHGCISLKSDLDRPLAMKPPGVPIWVSKAMTADHPLISFDAPWPKPHDKQRHSHMPLSAWMTLSAAIFTEIEVLNDDGCLPHPLVLHLRKELEDYIPDMARLWNWRPRDATPFVLGLAATTLITDELATAIVARIGRSREKRPPISKKTRAAIMAKTSGRCVYCGVPLTTKRDQPNSYHADHLLSVKDGATDDPGLLVPACADCNQKKGAKTFAEFMAQQRGKP